ncbi:hypothetical protein, partial [Pseudonocardia sp.]|uniref:hypothetical protein n=1 Tax=Pseudonocardia sp. TaxID=60912 RepID=UPI0031FCCC27
MEIVLAVVVAIVSWSVITQVMSGRLPSSSPMWSLSVSRSGSVAHGHAAVDLDDCAGDVAGRLGAQ